MAGQILNGNPMAAPQVAIAAPINDVQMIALLAAFPGMGNGPRECVENAMELLAEACVQGQHLPALIRDKARQAAERS